MSYFWTSLSWIGIIVGAIIVVIILLCIVNAIRETFFHDEWEDTLIDEAEMLEAEVDAADMDREGWDIQKRKKSCRSDIESGWRRVASARAVYGNEIIEEVRKEMKALGLKPGWRKRW
jgi:hypothetical protein